MAKTAQPEWILLEYQDDEGMNRSLKDRSRRLVFYPAVGSMEAGQVLDVQFTVEGSNVLFPMQTIVREVTERPHGPDFPRGVLMEVIEADEDRFLRMCAFVDGVWRPTARRTHPRYPALYQAKYKILNQFVSAETYDVSRAGLYLRTNGPLPEPMKPITVRVSPARLRASIELQAQVRWVDSVESRRGMGLLCTGSSTALEKLGALVDKIIESTKV